MCSPNVSHVSSPRRLVLLGWLAVLAALNLIACSAVSAETAPQGLSPQMAGMVDEEFRAAMGTGFDSTALAVATQADGKILVGGWFDRFDGTLSRRLARLLPDGSLDADFTAAIGSGFDSAVFAIAVQADGRIVLGGQFTQFNGTPVSRLVRLYPDGSLDQEFQSGLSGGPNGPVFSILEQAEGKLLIGGEFRNLHGMPGIVRLNVDGTSDEAFNANRAGAFSSPKVYSVAVDRQGRVWLGGDSLSTAGYSGTPRVVRLFADGAVDTDFGAKLGSALPFAVRTILPLEAGSFVAGSLLFPNGEDYTQQEVLSFGFHPLSLIQQSDGKLLGGADASPRRLSLLGLDRKLDAPFENHFPGISGGVYGLAVQSDGAIVAAGAFSGSFSGNRISRIQGYTPGEFLWVEGTTLRLVRGGGSPSAYRVVFQTSHDGASWEILGEATRAASGWEFAGASLEGWTHVRSLAMVRGGYSSGSGSVVARAISLGGDPQTITFGAMTPRSMGDDAIVPGATASSGLPVRFISSNAAVAAVNGGRIEIVGTGSTTIVAYQAGDDHYLPAAVVSRDLTVAMGSQAIAFDAPSPRTFRATSSSPFDLVAHASSGLPVSFSSSNPAIASIVGKRVTIHGAGEIEITAIQEGNEHYQAAPPVTRTLTIHRATQYIEFLPLDPMPLGRPPLPLEATARSGSFQTGLPVTFTSSDPSVASIENGAIVPHALGTVEITAHQEGNQDYLPATPVSRTLHVIEAPEAAGSMDMLFNLALGTGASWGIGAVALQPDGKILLGGSGSYFNGIEIGRLGRLHPDGSLDEAFRANIGSGFSGFSDTINAVVLQNDGRIVVGGSFRFFSGLSANRVFRFHGDGSIDREFRTNMGTGPSHGSVTVLDLALQTDEKLIVAGEFGSFSGHFIGRVVRLQADGALDQNFLAAAGTGANGRIRQIALQSDGKILLGGDFTSFNAIPAPRLVRLLPDGAVDQGFLQAIGAGPASNVFMLATNPDDSILLSGGDFFNGRSVGRMVLLDADGGIVEGADGNPFYDIAGSSGRPALQGDGRMLLPGGITRVGNRMNLPRGLVRLTEAGGLDEIVTSSIGSGTTDNVGGSTLQPDGKIWLSGWFQRFSGFAQIPYSLMRLNNDPGAAFLHWNHDGRLTWASVGAAPQPQRVLFQGRAAGGDWVNLGWAEYADRQWTVDEIDFSGLAEVRALARILGGGGGSGVLIRTSGDLDRNQQVITFPEIAARPYTAEQFPLGASASSGLPLHFFSSNPQVATVENGVVTLHRPGEATITAIQTGDSVNAPAAPVSRLLTAERLPQTIEFAALPPKPVGADSYPLIGHATSGLPVAFSSSNPPVASITGGYVSFHSPGEVVITARQQGNSFYLPADPVERTLTVLAVSTAPGMPDLVFIDRLGGGADGSIVTAVTGPDGSIIIGGAFSNFGDIPTGPLARLTAEGHLDELLAESIAGNLDGSVEAIYLQRDASLLVGGTFAPKPGNGIPEGLARLKADGEWDGEFAGALGAGFEGAVHGILELPDERILVWGDFSRVGGQPAGNVALLGKNGEIDSTFFGPIGTGSDGPVHTAVLLADGGILLGGDFSAFGPSPAPRLARLNQDGSVVAGFSAAIGSGPNGIVRAAGVTPQGEILVAGDFTTFDGRSAPRLVRLADSGEFDEGFSAGIESGPNGPVRSLAIQADGAVLIGGAFSSIQASNTPGIARLLPDGSLNASFTQELTLPGFVGGAVTLASDGRVVVAGDDASGSRLLRLFNDAAGASLEARPDGIALIVEGTAPWAGRVLFESSPDGLDWSPLGYAGMTNGAWVFPGTGAGEAKIRAIASGPGGRGAGSSGLAHYDADLPPRITSPLQHVAVAGHETTYRIEAAHSPVQFFATGLPAGLTLDGVSGVIGGAPVKEGTFEVEVAARNRTGAVGYAVVLLTVRPAIGPLPELTSASFSRVEAGQLFSYTVQVESQGLAFEIHPVRLPDGLVFASGSRRFSGTLPPGDHMIEFDLATVYGVVRETVFVTAYASPVTTEVSHSTSWLQAVTGTVHGRVAVGTGGTILRSDHSEEWAVLPTAVEADLFGVAHGMGRTVAVGGSGVIISSLNDDEWQQEISGVSTVLRRVEFLNDRFVAVGDHGVILTSLDGRAWTQPISGTINHLYAVAYGAGGWVAVGTGGLTLSSSDAANWQPAIVAGQGTFRGVAYGNEAFVAVSNSGNVVTSADGMNWEVQAAPGLGAFRDITFVGGRFLGLAESPLGYSFPMARLVSSEDGEGWVMLGEWSGSAYTGLSKNLDRWVAVGRSGRIVAAPDGVRVLAITGPKDLLMVEGQLVSEPISVKGEADRFGARGLPPGLHIDSDSGRIAGRPSQAGEFQSFLLAYDARGPARPFGLQIKVFPQGGTPAFTGTLVSNASAAGVISHTVAVSGLDETSLVTVGELPHGLTFNGATRVLSGALSAPGFYEIPVQATNVYGASEAIIRLSYPPTVAVESGSLGVSSHTVAVAYHDGRYVAATLGGHILSSTDGRSWTQVSGGSGNNEVIYANGLWVVVGDSSRVHTSANGVDWEYHHVGGSFRLEAVAYGNGVFVVVGSPGVAFVSSDGGDWTQHGIGASVSLRGITFGDGRFVAVGDDGTILTSTDGLAWSAETSGITANLRTVTFGHGRFVVGGTNSLLVSTVPGIWQEVGGNVHLSISTGIYSLIATADGFAALSGAVLLTSSRDALYWTRRYIVAQSPFWGLTYGADEYLMTGQWGATRFTPGNWTPVIVTETAASGMQGTDFAFQIGATDGATSFIAEGLPSGLVLNATTGRIEGVPLTAGTFTVKIAAGNRHGFSAFSDLTLHLEPAQGIPPVFTGPNVAGGVMNLPFSFAVPLQKMDAAIVFSAEGLPPGLAIDSETGTITGRPEVPGVFDAEVTVSNYYGQSQLPVRIVIQGNPWHYDASVSLSWPNDVSFGSGRYVAVGRSGAIWHSTNAENWSSAVSRTGVDLLRVVHGAGRFVAVGDSGVIVTSEDGVIWSIRFSTTTQRLNSIAYNGNLFVAVGEGGTVVVSSNGIDWTLQETPVTDGLWRVTHGGGVWVAVGANGAILSSATGTDWGLRDGLTTNDLGSVSYGNSRFVAVGSGPIVRLSDDGIAWSSVTPSGLGASAFSMIYGRDEFILLGPGWEVRTSPNGEDWTLRTPYVAGSHSRIAYVNDKYFFIAYSGLRVTDGHWAPGVIAPPSVAAWRGEPFSLLVEADGVHDRFYAINLPAGLSMNEGTGEISGVPEGAGDFEVSLYVDGDWGPSAVVALNLTVHARDLTPPAVGAMRSLLAEVNAPFSHELAFTGDTRDAESSVDGLPEGLSFNQATRRITGVPLSSGYFPLTVSIASPLGGSAVLLHLKVVEQIDATPVQASASVSAIVSYPFSFVPAIPLQATATEAFGLPPGLSVDAVTGNISGVPTAKGLYYVMIAGTGPSGTLIFQLTINVEYMAPQVISWPVSVLANPGEAVSFRVSALGSELEYRWRKDSVALDDDGRMTGSHGGELRIENVVAGDAGAYRVSVSNDRGFLAGEPVMLTVVEPFALWAERILPGGTGDWWEDSFGAGVPNLLWYAFGAEGPDRTQLPQMVRDGTWLDFHFFRSRSAEGVQLWIEESRNLLDWWTTEIPWEQIGEDRHIERWRLRVLATDLPRFFRVRAVMGE